MISENIEKVKKSFLELLMVKKYSKISIQEIADNAGISRRTFYQYYENKLQLFEDIVGDIIELSLRPFEKSSLNQLFSSKIEQFTYALIDNIEVVTCLFNEDCPNVGASVIKKILITQIQEDKSGFFLNKLNLPAAQKYYVETISQNCVFSINYVLQNKDLPKDVLIQGLCDACDTIAYFYKTDH